MTISIKLITWKTKQKNVNPTQRHHEYNPDIKRYFDFILSQHIFYLQINLFGGLMVTGDQTRFGSKMRNVASLRPVVCTRNILRRTMRHIQVLEVFCYTNLMTVDVCV